MQKRDRTSGFTLIELLVVLGVVTTLTAATFPYFIEAYDDAKLRVAVKESKILLKYLNKARTSSGGLTLSGSPTVYQHSVPSLPAGSSLANLETILGETTGLSANNPWGNPYRLQITAHYVRVQTTVPGNVSPPEAQRATVSGSNTILTFVSNSSGKTSLIKAQTANVKRQLYSEAAR